jgi:hypothetical protein
MKQEKETNRTKKTKTFNAQHSTANADRAGRSASANSKRPAPVVVMIDHPTLGRVKALHYPAIPGARICPQHGMRCRNWRHKRCERMMRVAIPTDLLLRLVYASPEQFAAVESILGIKAENGAEGVKRNP